MMLLRLWSNMSINFKPCSKPSILLKYIDKCGDNTDPTRVYQSSKAGFWPWMASIGSSSNREWNHECGATLISQTSIITAAHCVADDNKNR